VSVTPGLGVGARKSCRHVSDSIDHRAFRQTRLASCSTAQVLAGEDAADSLLPSHEGDATSRLYVGKAQVEAGSEQDQRPKNRRHNGRDDVGHGGQVSVVGVLRGDDDAEHQVPEQGQTTHPSFVRRTSRRSSPLDGQRQSATAESPPQMTRHAGRTVPPAASPVPYGVAIPNAMRTRRHGPCSGAIREKIWGAFGFPASPEGLLGATVLVPAGRHRVRDPRSAWQW
jgi:hypothetical protein